jgi:hypothetical protein
MIAKILGAVTILAIGGCLVLPTRAQDTFCALKLFVESEDGLRIRNALAELLDPSGKIIQSREVIEGHAEFCDFGFGYHSILVRGTSDDACDTMVKNVKVIYGQSQQIKVILNGCLGYRVGDISNGCFVYLRVSSETGEQLQGTKVLCDDRLQLFTDEYGRAQVGIHLFSGLELTFSRNGFETQNVHVECPYVPVNKEISIKMHPLKK